MRARFIASAIPTIQTSPHCLHSKATLADWLEKEDLPLHVEIGSGKGQFLFQAATEHPEILYIGIELEPNVLYRALERLDVSLPNLRFLWGDADGWLEDFHRPIERLYLQFSDPWPKDRHAKRRLTHPSRIEVYARLVKGTLVFKTDNIGLYEYSLTTLSAHFTLLSHGILHETESWLPSEFETKYRKLGKPIYFIEAKR